MKFSDALDLCMKGKKITRSDWNGRGMYVYYVKPHLVHAKDWKPGDLTEAEKIRGTVVVAGHFDMLNAQGIRIIGWLASQTDLSSDKWEVVE